MYFSDIIVCRCTVDGTVLIEMHCSQNALSLYVLFCVALLTGGGRRSCVCYVHMSHPVALSDTQVCRRVCFVHYLSLSISLKRKVGVMCLGIRRALSPMIGHNSDAPISDYMRK